MVIEKSWKIVVEKEWSPWSMFRLVSGVGQYRERLSELIFVGVALCVVRVVHSVVQTYTSAVLTEWLRVPFCVC